MRLLPGTPPTDRRSTTERPPRRAERFLASHLGAGARSEFILGDLREDYTERRDVSHTGSLTIGIRRNERVDD